MQYGRTLVAVMVTHVALDNLELATPGVGGHLACFNKRTGTHSNRLRVRNTSVNSSSKAKW